MERILLYHAGPEKISVPDIRRGRKNADFGQGFYLSGDAAFSRRWARSRAGEPAYCNAYALTLDGLRIKRFVRDESWFDYIFQNRAGSADGLNGFDVIVGPIANDTIYDTSGILTSGFLRREQALALLLLGPVYEQTVVKTDRAAAQLTFLGAQPLEAADLAERRAAAQREENAYLELFAAKLAELLGGEG